MIEEILEWIFTKKITQERIEGYIEKLPPIQGPREIFLDEIRISTVQRKIKLVRSIEEYIDMLYSFIKKATAEESQIVIYPEYNFFDLLGLIPGFSILNSFLNNRGKKKKTSPQGETDVSSLTPIFKAISPSIEKGIALIFPLLAKKANIYIYTGSFLFSCEKDLYNGGSLYGPDGKFIGTQGKLHLTDFEEEIGLVRKNSLAVYDLPIGKIAFPICMDASYFETFYRARELDVELVILPIANSEEYNPWRALRGIWPRVQESYIYGAKASLNGWIAGMHFTGKAGVFAPLALTPEKDGLLAISSHYEDDQLITASINYQKLKIAKENAQYYGDVNQDFEEHFIERTYFNFP